GTVAGDVDGAVVGIQRQASVVAADRVVASVAAEAERRTVLEGDRYIAGRSATVDVGGGIAHRIDPPDDCHRDRHQNRQGEGDKQWPAQSSPARRRCEAGVVKRTARGRRRATKPAFQLADPFLRVVVLHLPHGRTPTPWPRPLVLSDERAPADG